MYSVKSAGNLYTMKRFQFGCQIILIAVLLFFLFGSTAEASQKRTCPGTDQTCPEIVDANFKECLKKTTGKDFESMSDKELLNITSLTCENMGIKDISGIENLVNLSELYMRYNSLHDLSPLSSLVRLKKLYLWDNKIENVSALLSLKGLKELYLNNNQIKDASPLSGLVNLTDLLLGNNNIQDISPLSGLTDLQWLELYSNSISAIQPLKNLTKTYYLDLSDNSIADIKGLKKLTGLKSLYLHRNAIREIKALQDLKSLKVLFLGDNLIKDISALSGLSQTRVLHLDNNLITDIAPLQNLSKLKRVSILNNCIFNFSYVENVKNVSGIEYQHLQCENPNLVKRSINKEWLDTQLAKQCMDYGENDHSLKIDYDYHPDGIYYSLFLRDRESDSPRKVVCRLLWNSQVGNFLASILNTEGSTDKYEVYQFRKNNLYVMNGMLKGYSLNNFKKSRGNYSVLEDISRLFKYSYKLKPGKDKGYQSGEGEKHFMRIVDEGNNYSLQFFEKGFFTKEIAIEN